MDGFSSCYPGVHRYNGIMSCAVGSEYERLLEAFLEMGGDLSLCPFDAEGYLYEGPRIEEGEMVRETPNLPSIPPGH